MKMRLANRAEKSETARPKEEQALNDAKGKPTSVEGPNPATITAAPPPTEPATAQPENAGNDNVIENATIQVEKHPMLKTPIAALRLPWIYTIPQTILENTFSTGIAKRTGRAELTFGPIDIPDPITAEFQVTAYPIIGHFIYVEIKEATATVTDAFNINPRPSAWINIPFSSINTPPIIQTSPPTTILPTPPNPSVGTLTSEQSPLASTSPSTKKGISTGAIVGIAISLLVLLGLGVAAFMIYTRRAGRFKRKRNSGGSALAGKESWNSHEHPGESKGSYHEASRSAEEPEANVPMQIIPIASKISDRARPNVPVLPPAPVEEPLIFDQPKDDDAVKTLFEEADEALLDHIENYYIPVGDISEEEAINQLKRVPGEDYDRIEIDNVLARRSKLLMNSCLRGYALRAVAAYYLYEAITDDLFNPVDVRRRLSQIKTNRHSQSPQRLEKSRLVEFHRLVQSEGYTSQREARISKMTKRLNDILTPFAINNDPERHANLQNVVRRFADLALTLGKQPCVYRAELRMQDFSNAEVPRTEKDGKVNMVRYVKQRVDVEKMTVENNVVKDISTVNAKVRGVVSPGIRKYTADNEGRKRFENSTMLRKAKVVML